MVTSANSNEKIIIPHWVMLWMAAGGGSSIHLESWEFQQTSSRHRGACTGRLKMRSTGPCGQGAEALLTHRNRIRYRHLGEKHTRLTRINTWPTPVKSVNLNREPLNP
jgi:hypothetical protein